MENNNNKFDSRERRPWRDRDTDKTSDWKSERKPYKRNEYTSFRGKDDSYDNGHRRSHFSKPYRKYDSNRSETYEDRPYRERRSYGENKEDNIESRSYRPRRFDSYGERSEHRSYNPRFSSNERGRRPYRNSENNGDEGNYRPRRYNNHYGHKNNRKPYNSYSRPIDYTSIDKNLIAHNFDDDWNDEDMVIMDSVPEKPEIEFKRPATETEGYRLNRFISNAGVCSRRAADDYIADGRITVNGQVVTDFSTRVFPQDEVCLDGKKLISQHRVYIVFNKPKDCISTKSDPEGRRTVFDYVKSDVEVENVGRLDRNTTGVMLFTNDGDLIERLTHPRYNKMKIYHVFLNKNLSAEDFEAIRNGVDFEDGHVDVDDLQYVEGERNQVGIQIHSGMNRVVRRIFESKGYEVEKLDRVYFAGLTKKDLPRGHWRYLTQKEVAILKRGAYA